MANKYEYVQRSIGRRRDWVATHKNKPCVDCCVSYPTPVMEFHHLDPATKDFAIGTDLTRHGRARLIAEMEKCVLVCANCHRLRHIAGWSSSTTPGP